jgi:DNA-binding beta-propeller fold protein YncE
MGKLGTESRLIAAGLLICGAAMVQAQSMPAWTVGPYQSRSGGQMPPCGQPQIKINDGLPVYPPGEFPIKLPAVSPHGVHNDLPDPYQAPQHFGKLPNGRQWVSSASVTTAPDGSIWVLDRPTDKKVNPIVHLDTEGNVIKEFGADVIVTGHKMSHDKEGNLWVADLGGSQVLKLSQDGKVLMTIGKKGVPGLGADELFEPTSVAVADSGDIFVAEGHTLGGPATTNRIAKFDKSGHFIKAWGRKGVGPGEFDVIHQVVFDSKGRLFVADRNNSRVQIFDKDGKLIDIWYQFGRPSGIYIDPRTDTMYVGDSESRDGYTNTGQYFFYPTGYGYDPGVQRGIRVGSARDGKVKYFIPDPCPYPYPGGGSFVEGLTSDFNGNVYAADLFAAIWKVSKK